MNKYLPCSLTIKNSFQNVLLFFFLLIVIQKGIAKNEPTKNFEFKSERVSNKNINDVVKLKSISRRDHEVVKKQKPQVLIAKSG